MMKTVLKAAVCLLLLQQSLAFAVQPRETPDVDKSTPEMIAKHGYPIEIHYVTTEDGYILQMHRIPYSPSKSPAKEGKPAVLVQHGLLMSSFDWVVQGPGKSLAYLLADLGYDVWLGNGRGNTYSRNHTTMNPNKSKFWHFSWHEMGIYDIAAEIDYILELNGQEQLNYIGHSMGSTMNLVLLSEKPEYNAKIKEAAYLAPIAEISHSTSAIRLLVPFLDTLDVLANLMGIDEFAPRNGLWEFLGEVACRENAPIQDVCADIIFLLFGWDSQELNRTMLPIMAGHTPAGAATRDMIHYGQVIRSKRFQKYDYGFLQNLRKYGQVRPPVYDLSKVTAPISLHYGDNDNLADPKDVQWLANHLPNLVGNYRVPLSAFTHLDFLWARDVETLVNNRVASLVEEFP